MAHTSSTITALKVYPLKSCRGISVPSIQLNTLGLDLDRKWMIVDKNNQYVSIRQRPQMWRIETAIDQEKDELVITPGGDAANIIRLPLNPDEDWLQANCNLVEVDVMKYKTDAWMFTDRRIRQVLNDFLRLPQEGALPCEDKGHDLSEVNLVMKGPTDRIPGGCAHPSKVGRHTHISFPDDAPILFASESSIEALNKKLIERNEKEISIDRFRPNIIIKGDLPWSEDEWKTIRINGDSSWWSTLSGANRDALDIDIVSRSVRCQIPNHDPVTAQKHAKQPWDTLVSFRRIDPGAKYQPCFGMLGVPRNEGKLEVGMRFEVTEITDKHHFLA